MAPCFGLEEFPPIIEPALKGLKALPIKVSLVDDEELQPVHERFEHISTETASRIYQLVEANQDFKKLVGERYVNIGISKIEQRKESDSYLLVAYNYQSNRAVEVSFDCKLNLKKVEEANYQPAPTNEEIRRAVALARNDERIRPYLSEEMTGGGILTHILDREDPNCGTRLLDVRIGYDDERLPIVRALVNLGEDRVVAAGLVQITHKTKEVHHGC